MQKIISFLFVVLMATQSVFGTNWGNSGITSNSNILMNSGDYFTNADSSMFFTVQNDGNLCVYAGSGPANNLGYVKCVRAYSLPTAGNYNVKMYYSGVMGEAKGMTPLWSCIYNLAAGQGLPDNFSFFINKTSDTTANMVITASNASDMQVCF